MDMIQFKDWKYDRPDWLYNWLNKEHQFGVNAQFVDVRGCRNVSDYVLKAKRESVWIKTVILLPSRTDTAWFHDHCSEAVTIMFLRGRLDAVENDTVVGKAGFPHMVVVFSNVQDGVQETKYIDTKEIRG